VLVLLAAGCWWLVVLVVLAVLVLVLVLVPRVPRAALFRVPGTRVPAGAACRRLVPGATGAGAGASSSSKFLVPSS
jgi:hypothetical protein